MSVVGDIGTVVAQLKNMPVPEGWLPCDGRCYAGKDFPELYRMLKGNRKESDPLDYFRVPDERQVLPGSVLITLIIRAG